MAAVTVPAEFFRAELRVYGDWREAFVRELLQNSTDAKSSRIDVTFSTVNGRGRITFVDDGQGMSRQVLEDVFFALGRSTKSGENSIGGFGRARIIICFAQHSYTIRTGNLLVEGAGGQYTITEMPAHRTGCEFTIDLIDDSPDNVRWALRGLLEDCSRTAPSTCRSTSTAHGSRDAVCPIGPPGSCGTPTVSRGRGSTPRRGTEACRCRCTDW